MFGGRSKAQFTGLLLGPLLAGLLLLAPQPEGLSPEGWRVAALLILMAVWWATEAIPIPATSLLPLIIIPIIGAGSAGESAAGYSSTIVLLLMGGFIVAMGIERWNLHTRIALNIVAQAGSHTRLIIAGFMLATALISAWISNTATTLMMVPIAISVARESGDKTGLFSKALLLGICYAASIGGVATPIGTPTNLIAIEWLQKNTGNDIGYLQWMAFGVPAMLLLIPFAWFVVTRGLPHSGKEQGSSAENEVKSHLAGLGRISRPEARVAMVFGLIAFLWVIRERFQHFFGEVPGLKWSMGISDMGIAAFGAVLMFLVPAGDGEKRSLLTWEEAVKLPWGVILLFGGGISLGNAVNRTGLAKWLGELLSGLEGAPAVAIVLVVVILVVYLTEVTSNVATMTTLAPVLGAFAIGIGVAPSSLLAPAAVAASCAFMLPVATAPNAIVYASGHITVKDMIKAGFWINAGAVVIITIIGAYLAPLVL
jgi:sodium-dependent dicarboxylate transporter 2/3/5